MAGQKPLIAINMDFKVGRNAAPSIGYLFSGYYDSIMKAGGIPVAIPPYVDDADLDRVLDLVDGVVMIGGGDIDPRNDGYMLHPSIRLMAPRREDFDRRLIKKVYERRMPFFGIGAGMQLLNVTMGGTLFLHIAEDIGTALPHYEPDDPWHRHALVIEPGSLLDRVYGDNAVLVNSIHHMAVDDVAEGFLVTAKCPDSVVEAIESIRDDWFAIGTQFHPEAPSATVLDLRIFGEFIAGIIKRSNKELVAPCSEEAATPAPEHARPKSRKKTPRVSIRETDDLLPRENKSAIPICDPLLSSTRVRKRKCA
ncbi:MAG: gamma-glutamyl-gamma-aminobutyrate hydrolase family protein [Thermoguttaceae bacterium]|nr:gamma-glutamyl-gamma-aminobutyrate hydrolase family protein [Thermoguttaceae bacterium]MBQ2684325.1 gamma-glutamyl-gamma-aminobutyrate hydrolase family protein [Thermoguttaceae bacterium]MBQ6620961.1 gamma-glutamyl-gamma-aminobutyrate hydrolase family protein [Thermoguttaceae bacterium]MBR2585061.1 gamma-glutamyl-gamma-aminobutyrate hydrolase family protein [Thermoguttaceae bacterium]